MSATRHELQELLEAHFRASGWKPERVADGTVRATGIDGVTWIGLPVLTEDLADEAFEPALLDLADQRMPAGQLCPLELLPTEECADDLRSLLDRLRLRDRGHVEVYSLAA